MFFLFPNGFLQLAVLVAFLTTFYGFMYYHKIILNGILPDWVVAVPLLIVGLALYLRFMGFNIKLKRKPLYGKRYGHTPD